MSVFRNRRIGIRYPKLFTTLRMSIEISGYEPMVEHASMVHSSTCSPSTSGASSPGSCIPRSIVRKMKRKLSRRRYLLAIEDRNRLRRMAVRKVKLASKAVSAISLLRWEQKIDRKYEKEFDQKRVGLKQLMRENDILRANRRIYVEGCSILQNYAMVLKVKLCQEEESEFGQASAEDCFPPHF